MKDLAERMKRYENITAPLQPNTPLLLRLDGRAFHTFTRGMKKPFDPNLIAMMDHIALELCEEIQNTRMAYIQSDEISILIHDKPESSTWFGNNLQKIISVSASYATSVATQYNYEHALKPHAHITFDARIFPLPPHEINNYYIWRQKDWERNSLSMLARAHYSHRQLQGKNQNDLHDLLHEKDINWNDLPTHLKRGRTAIQVLTKMEIDNTHYQGTVNKKKWVIDEEPPIFAKDPRYIEEHHRPLSTYLEQNRKHIEER